MDEPEVLYSRPWSVVVSGPYIKSVVDRAEPKVEFQNSLTEGKYMSQSSKRWI